MFCHLFMSCCWGHVKFMMFELTMIWRFLMMSFLCDPMAEVFIYLILSNLFFGTLLSF